MHSGHRDRMRKKFFENGLDSFPDHEKLEFLLFFSIQVKNTNEIAHNLINTFGSLSAVFEAQYDALKTVPGVGDNTALLLKTVFGLFRCYLNDKNKTKGKAMTLESIGETFVRKFIGLQNENVMIMLLDSKYKLLYCGIVSEGSVNAAEIYVRKIVELAMKYNASKAVIAHNHPSGIALPSRDDLESTKELSESLKLIGVKLIDHVIVADDDYVSLVQSNLGSELF